VNLRIFDTTGDLVAGAERAVLQRIEQGARTIALSGGSTPKPLYQSLGHKDALRSVPLTWVIVDERYVPIDDPQSNAGMIQQTLFADGMAPAHRFLRFRTELGDPAATAREFEREWQSLHIERLDLVLLGMGDDGHTASLFPGTPVLNVEDRIASEVYVPRMNSWRVTLTKPVLRAAQMRFVLAAGEAKRPVLQRVRAGSDDPIAQVTRDTETWWFVDRAAVDSTE
jgi:6-phosphogluconolactonase